jgi:membrane protease YdiL (CAAX protease family)
VSDVPFQQPRPVPPLPEVPEGVTPAAPPPAPAEPALGPDDTRRFAWWAPFVALVLTFVAAGVIAGIAAVFASAFGAEVKADDVPPGITVVATIVQGAMFIGFSYMLAAISGVRPSPWAFGLRPSRFWIGLGFAFLAALCFYIFAFVWSVALGIEESDDLAKELGAEDSTLALIGVLLMACIVAPIAEEFFFRGFCFPALSNVLGWFGGALVTGFVFGAIHFGGTDSVFLPPLMFLGFLLCLLYRFTGSLLPCIALHAFNNALAMAATLEWEVWQGVLAVVLAPCVVLLIVRPFVRKQPAAPALA